jgi:hypothetical protein
MRALTSSMALVVQTIRRISGSKPRNGTNSAHAASHSRAQGRRERFLKDANGEQFADAVRAVAAGETPPRPAATRRGEDFCRGPAPGTRPRAPAVAG